jgi:hypothetical protein
MVFRRVYHIQKIVRKENVSGVGLFFGGGLSFSWELGGLVGVLAGWDIGMRMIGFG